MDLGKLEQMILAKVNTTSSSSEKTYKCDKCFDSGWISFTDENGYRFESKCSCRLAREAEDLLRASGLSDAVGQQTFDAFKTNTIVQQNMKQKAEAYLKDLFDEWDEPRRPWLYVGGNPGAGKTHICTAVCGEILRHNIGVRYMQWLNEVKRLKYINDDSFEDAVDEYVSPSVLYIDDLLKQKYTEHPVFTEADIKIAFTILNARYLMNKPTIISSEWDLLDQLLEADEGVFSRVYERCKGHIISIERKPENNFRLTGG